MALLEHCRLCPRECGARRLDDEAGICGVRSQAVLSSYGPHFGEETPLVGTRGSGTIFLTHCNLRCVFCQNFEISQRGEREAVSIALTGSAEVLGERPQLSAGLDGVI